MIITAEILGFFVWIFIEAKYPREKTDEIFDEFADEIIELFNKVLNGECLEGYCFFENCDVSLKREKEGFILKIKFPGEKETKAYLEGLERYRSFNSKDLLIFGINPENPFDVGAQVNQLLKSENITWGLINPKTVEIKIRDG